ncbi:hypothetical protein [Ileibacterium valens]|uniref:Uncharacterized protein n=1 Tax=Ileibacterium valens TaxID=1862668 RepID=A0A1U7NIH3_9FIRM|nr:hypothetical protein [Ileibacterium valens]OLU37589.1 hypothetical protein BM735_10380 [Erysipelotrichaceae bacterium NYU-BL-F16]OLU41939.1 hypothetical protein BO224_02755 [Erysipelotrichaceae bacterium NYU-BL-E8]OLU42230.1 hypothetical protein BO222_01965 [Ileibacterium valens]
MKGWMSILAKIAAAAAVLAAAAAILYRFKKRKDQEELELDEYLMSPQEDIEPVHTFYVQEDLDDMLSEDAEEWNELPEDERVIVSFHVEPARVHAFMDSLAKIGVSTAFDEDNHILDVYVTGPMNADELQEVAAELQSAAKSNDVSYVGYAFE